MKLMEIKYIISPFLIAGFFAVAMLGVLAMNPAGGHGFACFASMAEGRPCVGDEDVFGSLNFHLNAFKDFSTAIFGGSIFAFLLLFLALSLTLIFITGLTTNLAISHQAQQLSKQHSFPPQRKIARWLSFHENSPNFS
jgi:hypothetical protein